MTDQAVEEFGTESLVGILQELFGFPADVLAPTTTLDELGLDSLALLEMGAFLQERTGVEVGSRLGEVSRSAPLEEVARTVAAFLAQGR